MTRANSPTGKPNSPAIADLLARYLQRQADAQASGLATLDAAGEVVPFEAAPTQPVDSRVAWKEALTVVQLFDSTSDTNSWQAPPDWSTLVGTHEPVMALAFAVGNFPQLVRNLQPLLRAGQLAELRHGIVRPVPVPALVDWADQTVTRKQYPLALLALGCLRLAKQFDRALQLLKAHAGEVPAQWQAAWLNEQAALAWHGGRSEEALALWQEQEAGIPVLFNRGMANLFLDRPAEARPSLQKAVAQLPEDSAWHHLGRLYLALAEMR